MTHASIKSIAAVDDLMARLNSMSSMSATFKQEVMEGRRVIQASTGRLFLQRLDKFRWQSNSPTSQLIVSNGHTLWVYDKDLEQVTMTTLDKKNQSTPILLLNGYEQSLKDGYDVSIKKFNSQSVFHLIPKNPEKNAYLWIDLTYQKNKLKRLTVEDKLGQITRLMLFNASLNLKLEPTLFTFTPPEGVDIVQ